MAPARPAHLAPTGAASLSGRPAAPPAKVSRRPPAAAGPPPGRLRSCVRAGAPCGQRDRFRSRPTRAGRPPRSHRLAPLDHRRWPWPTPGPGRPAAGASHPCHPPVHTAPPRDTPPIGYRGVWIIAEPSTGATHGRATHRTGRLPEVQPRRHHHRGRRPGHLAGPLPEKPMSGNDHGAPRAGRGPATRWRHHARTGAGARLNGAETTQDRTESRPVCPWKAARR